MYRKVFWLLCINSIIALNAFAQNRNNIWCFGDSAGIDFNGAIPLPIVTSLDTRGSCVSVADTAGQLLFYANTRANLPGKTTLVWNRNHQLIQSGDSLVGEGWYKELVIIPFPASDSLYYLFCAGGSTYTGFYYSIIDISQNSGLGAVVQKNIQLQGQNFFCNDGITAVKHGNGRDWWVINRRWDTFNNQFYFYLVSPMGVNLDHIQTAGDIVQSSFYRIEPSNDGNKIACITNGGLLSVYDFDRCTGNLFNELSLEHEVTNPNLAPWYWDCELSPNNNLLYVSQLWYNTDSLNYLFQYNLTDSIPSLTRDTLDSVYRPAQAGLIELAPNGKIYWTFMYNISSYPYPDSVFDMSNMYLSVINQPDSIGIACDFQPFSFYLGGKRTYYGLPNNPNYELGPDSGSVCDTLGVGISEIIVEGNSQLNVYYHSNWQKLFVNAQNIKGKNCLLQIFDMNGREIYASPPTPLRGRGEYFTQEVNCSAFAKGMYVVILTTEKERLVKKFVKE